MADPTLEQRLVELETRLAFQEQAMHELSDALAETRLEAARNADRLPLTEALGAERVAQRDAGNTGDFKNAVFAFLQKRQPTFEGR